MSQRSKTCPLHILLHLISTRKLNEFRSRAAADHAAQQRALASVSAYSPRKRYFKAGEMTTLPARCKVAAAAEELASILA